MRTLILSTLAGLLATAAVGVGPAQANTYTRVNYSSVHDTVEFNPALTCAASVIVCPAMPSRTAAAQ